MGTNIIHKEFMNRFPVLSVLHNVTSGRLASDVPWRACESLGIGEVTEPPSGLAPQKDFKPFDPHCCENVWFEESFPAGCSLKV